MLDSPWGVKSGSWRSACDARELNSSLSRTSRLPRACATVATPRALNSAILFLTSDTKSGRICPLMMRESMGRILPL